MKIYFEGIDARAWASTNDDLLALQDTDSYGDCPGQCSSPDPADEHFHNTATDFWQNLDDIAWQPSHTFYQPLELYIHAYTHEYVFVCAPTDSGRMAVL